MLAVILLLFCVAAHAESGAPDSTNEGLWQAASETAIHGPSRIPLSDQATLDLPEALVFIPREQAAPVMQSWGNTVDERFLGLIMPTDDRQWIVSIDYASSGYVPDDEARDWDADALLQNLREGTEAANEHRASVGVPPIKVTGWIQAPHYDAATHRLLWAAGIENRDIPDDNPGVNFNTYVLGREGYLSLNLITSQAEVESHRRIAQELLAGTQFVDGKRYEEFDSDTDAVAAFGIAALVGGVAAKKLGFFALLAAFAAKWAKVLIFAAVGGLALLRRMFNKGKATESAPQGPDKPVS